MRFALLAATLFAAPLLLAGDEKKGMQPGDAMQAFDVKDVTGKYKDLDKICYVWRARNAPVVVVLTTEVDKPLAGLVKELDKMLANNKEAVGFLLLLTDDMKASSAALTAFAAEHGITNMAMTMTLDGKKLPDWLKMDPDRKHTTIVYKDKKVVHATGISKEVAEKERKDFVAEAAKVLAPAAPPEKK